MRGAVDLYGLLDLIFACEIFNYCGFAINSSFGSCQRGGVVCGRVFSIGYTCGVIMIFGNGIAKGVGPWGSRVFSIGVVFTDMAMNCFFQG